MKKLLCAILAAVMVLAVTACGGGSDEPKKLDETVLAMDQNGVSIEFALYSDGDTVKQIVQKSILDGSAFTDEQIQTLIDSTEQYAASYEAFEGVTYEFKQDGTKLIETITIDTTDMDMLQALSDAGLVPLDAKNADFISLEKTIENLKAMGMTEK